MEQKMLNLPTNEQTYSTNSENTPKKALPAGTYQAKLAYMFFDKGSHFGTEYPYQEVQFKWLVYPGDASEEIGRAHV